MFAIAPTIAASGPRVAALRGGFFGLVAYATYDLTNQATLKGWPVAITIADLIWGTVLSAVAAALGHTVAVRLSRKKILAPAGQ